MRQQGRFTVRDHAALKILMACLVVLYVLIANWGGRRSERGEYFPVFNWSLFSYVSPVRGLIELHVKRIGDTTFEHPINFFELDSYFPTARDRSTDLKKNLERLVIAQASGDMEEVTKLRKLIESRHLSGHGTVAYELVYVVFRPVERWKTGRITRERVLAEWQTGSGP